MTARATPSPAAPPASEPRLSATTRLFWSNLAAQFSEQVALAAAPLAAVLLLNASAAETSLLQTAQTLPFLLLSIPAGVLADRASRLRMIVGSEALRALSLAAILGLALAGALTLPWLAALGFVGAVGTVAYSVAAPALVPQLVPRERLGEANRGLELARSLAFAGGPAAGGAFVAWTGVPAAYVIATILSLMAVAILAGLAEPARVQAPRKHLVAEIQEGAAFVWRQTLLRPILVTAVIYNASWFVLQAVYVAYAVRALSLSAFEVGLTLAIYGVGMVAGALAAPAIARRVTVGAMIATGPASAFVAALLIAATLIVPSVLLVAAAFFLFGAGPILWTITTTTLRQNVTPGAMLGRVSALIMTATFGARPVGAGLAALVAATIGVEACLVLVAFGFAAQFLVLFASPVRRLVTMPHAAQDDAALVRT